MYCKLSLLLPRYPARVEVPDVIAPRHSSFDDTQPSRDRLVTVGDQGRSNAPADCEVPHPLRNARLNYSYYPIPNFRLPGANILKLLVLNFQFSMRPEPGAKMIFYSGSFCVHPEIACQSLAHRFTGPEQPALDGAYVRPDNRGDFRQRKLFILEKNQRFPLQRRQTGNRLFNLRRELAVKHLSHRTITI